MVIFPIVRRRKYKKEVVIVDSLYKWEKQPKGKIQFIYFQVNRATGITVSLIPLLLYPIYGWGGGRIDSYNVHRVLQGFWFTPPLNFFTPTPEAFFPPNVVQILYI
jgi:hypothetical protein